MLIIRLQRVGKKNEPTFRIVLTDSKNSTKSGKFLEILGSYDARDKNESKVNADRVKELIANGAQLSDTVRNFLINEKIIEGKKVNVLPKKTPIVKEAPEGEVEKAPEVQDEPEAEVKEESSPEESAPAEEKPAESEKTENVPEEKEVKEEASSESVPEETKPEPESKTEEKPAEETPEPEAPAEEDKKSE